MPAAAARAPRPIATRTPLMAMTAVQALCRIAKTIPDQPKTFRREERDSLAPEVRSGAFSAARTFCSVVEFSGTTIEFNGGQKLRPIEMDLRQRISSELDHVGRCPRSSEGPPGSTDSAAEGKIQRPLSRRIRWSPMLQWRCRKSYPTGIRQQKGASQPDRNNSICENGEK